MRPLPLCPSIYLFELANSSKFMQVKGARADNSMIIYQAEKGTFFFIINNLGILFHLFLKQDFGIFL